MPDTVHRNLEAKKTGESSVIYLVIETAYFSIEETTHCSFHRLIRYYCLDNLVIDKFVYIPSLSIFNISLISENTESVHIISIVYITLVV